MIERWKELLHEHLNMKFPQDVVALDTPALPQAIEDREEKNITLDDAQLDRKSSNPSLVHVQSTTK